MFTRRAREVHPTITTGTTTLPLERLGGDEENEFDGFDADSELIVTGTRTPLACSQDAKLAFVGLTVTVGGHAPLKGAIGYIRKASVHTPCFLLSRLTHALARTS